MGSPRRGLLAPSEFIDLAEETGLIVPLGRLVLGDASRLHHELRAAGLADESLALSVNVSTRELDEPRFAAEYAELLKDLRLDPAKLILEITESALGAGCECGGCSARAAAGSWRTLRG